MKEIIKGSFQVGSNDNVSGILNTEDGSKEFNCWSSEFFNVESHSDIYGKTSEGKYISLINCLGNTGRHIFDKKTSFNAKIYSHLMIIGTSKILPSEDLFKSISLTIDNPERMIPRLSGFDYINFPNDELLSALKRQEYHEELEPNEGAVIAYFDGNFEIFNQETKIGRVSASNCVSTGGGYSINGVSIKNKVVVNINFEEPLLLEEAFERAYKLSLFMRFVSGSNLHFGEICLKKDCEDEHQELLVFHSNYYWGEDKKDRFASDPLVDINSEEFLRILKNWFDKEDRDTVRYSFYGSYFQEDYSPSRLIAVANLFDIFPKIIGEEKNKLPEGSPELLENLKSRIKTDLENFEAIKQSLLHSISKISDKSLKDRIFERISILEEHLTTRPLSADDLRYIVRKAILVRNFFVHGSQKDNLFKKVDPFEFQSLFIDTLEYIYGWSELIENGWSGENIKIWNEGHKMHFLEETIIGDLRMLKDKLKRKS
ncbi:hypothetical protein D1814_17570 [Alteromonas sp. BL110]|uniref:ApeA N-terminal domain 1-containing protein n=1 Tax=Alteromonas sp. BL110 TaxID=1714845 RepID=UPI000E527C7F|nr:hypothetical protein [Alteromonas sp. BL110]AXT40360.1 hypothetical protein D1814_17570 [Alteromonas sp. BL110]RKM79592.1 hypothetical protein D7031_11565 [Alteromonas sp. BL110]